jgi:imidazolonepropionase-like amidohydrolase
VRLRCADGFNRKYFGSFFTDRDLWLMVTRNAASVTATNDAIGSIATGLVADLAIFDGRARGDHRAILDAEPADVELVLRGGKPLYGDAPLVSALAEGCDPLTVCGAA